MIQKEHVCAICCRPEADCDVISGQTVKTLLCYIVVHFEAAGSSSFRDIKKSFRDGGGGGGGEHRRQHKRKLIRVSLKDECELNPINEAV